MTDDRGLALLTGQDVSGLLAAALATSDEELLSWRVRQVDHRPGASTTVAYDATVRGSAGEGRHVLAASTGPRTQQSAPGVLVLSDGAEQVAVWRFPLDPALPALARAMDEQYVRSLLGSYDVSAGSVQLRLRTYRPRRRAVVEVQAGGRRLFLKVLRPTKVAGLHQRHRLLTEAGVPVPRSLGWSDDGLLVLDGLGGTPLRDRLRQGGSPAPDGRALLALLDRLPPQVCELPLRRSWTDEVGHYAEVLGSALPSEAARCVDIAAEVGAFTDDSVPEQPSHGDFYETQLLLDGPRISGLLDVDTAGPGRRADDLACLLAHISVLAQMEPEHRITSNALGGRWLAAFDRTTDAVDLRARVAGVVVSLATGPHRVQLDRWQDATRARLDLAEQWLDGAGRVASGRTAPVG